MALTWINILACVKPCTLCFQSRLHMLLFHPQLQVCLAIIYLSQFSFSHQNCSLQCYWSSDWNDLSESSRILSPLTLHDTNGSSFWNTVWYIKYIPDNRQYQTYLYNAATINTNLTTMLQFCQNHVEPHTEC